MKISYKLSIFFSFIVIFSFLYYKSENNLDIATSFNISVSYQTFNGTDVLGYNDRLKNISSVQMILSYLVVILFISELF